MPGDAARVERPGHDLPSGKIPGMIPVRLQDSVQEVLILRQGNRRSEKTPSEKIETKATPSGPPCRSISQR
jgi:hypothetical protein